MPSSGNTFLWVLAAFPLYLMLRGRLTVYLTLATTPGATANTTTGVTATTATTNQVVAP